MLTAGWRGSADEEKTIQPVGFVSMMDILHLMLSSMKRAFSLPATDTMAIQMRLERVTESAGEFAQATCKTVSPLPSVSGARWGVSEAHTSFTPFADLLQVCDNKWNAIRPGYSVNDVGSVFAKGASTGSSASMVP